MLRPRKWEERDHETKSCGTWLSALERRTPHCLSAVLKRPPPRSRARRPPSRCDPAEIERVCARGRQVQPTCGLGLPPFRLTATPSAPALPAGGAHLGKHLGVTPCAAGEVRTQHPLCRGSAAVGRHLGHAILKVFGAQLHTGRGGGGGGQGARRGCGLKRDASSAQVLQVAFRPPGGGREAGTASLHTMFRMISTSSLSGNSSRLVDSLRRNGGMECTAGGKKRQRGSACRPAGRCSASGAPIRGRFWAVGGCAEHNGDPEARAVVGLQN